MRHPKRQSWSCALFCVFFLFFFNILTSPAFALPATPSASISASLISSTSPAVQTQLTPSQNRKRFSSAASAPSPGLGSETPQATEGAAPAPAPAPAPGASPATSTTAPDERIPQHLIQIEQLEDAGIKAAASLPSPPPYKPIVTPPPDQDSQLAKMGYSMTTFYTCDTIGGQEHCGWHVPVLKADAPTTRTDVRVVLAVVSCLAGILAWGLV
ncbi:hypothetical protein N5P37_005565 [Trichoderma harzianum]|uniref:Uncharacterized protein n=1 Tax=Trichoderma harzianum CBS 226.95 TaxID=983964 RepID=A0A2T4ABJ1_TRIHA|nr:hypothetical protein M431DRAFT_507884 [Trichoderma harzianum CBS 226.95]KAK0762747.1 hypothetical protein N5P37_005565 [Trichoderma harzianum]PKK52167.1 hypothetical protein CI102_2501 [Trichoderma harzianum]PTB54437.1 hypothetical protein M431DRAFT_507884 [Trichoderma harzianum CBS 226.95]